VASKNRPIYIRGSGFVRALSNARLFFFFFLPYIFKYLLPVSDASSSSCLLRVSYCRGEDLCGGRFAAAHSASLVADIYNRVHQVDGSLGGSGHPFLGWKNAKFITG